MSEKMKLETPPKNKRDYWAMIKQAFGEKPVNVNAQLNYRTQFYKDILTNIVKGRFKVKCPDWWSVDYMLDLLIFKGRFFITDSVIGVAPFDGNAFGINVFKRAPSLTVVNPILNTFERKLFTKRKNAVCVYLYDDLHFRNLTSVIDIYAEKLANVDGSTDINLINTRVPYIFNASDSKQAEEAKLIYDKISRGEPAIFTKVKDVMNPQEGGLDVSTLPVRDMFIADLLFEMKKAIMADFLTLIGVNTTSYEKKERLIKDEVNSNNAEILYNISYSQKNLERQSKQVREMFGIEFEIGWEEEEKITA